MLEQLRAARLRVRGLGIDLAAESLDGRRGKANAAVADAARPDVEVVGADRQRREILERRRSAESADL